MYSKKKKSFSTKHTYEDIFVWKEENGNSNMEIFDLLPIFSIFLPSFQFEMLHGKRHGSSMSVFGLKWRSLTRNMRFDVLQRHLPSSSRRCGRCAHRQGKGGQFMVQHNRIILRQAQKKRRSWIYQRDVRFLRRLWRMQYWIKQLYLRFHTHLHNFIWTVAWKKICR